ncbi:MAG TPA: hypothetical protein VIC33_05170 [Vicinamibacterales bacterium]
MILVAVDDLMFASKIRAAAAAIATPVVFAKSPDDLLERARAERPSLVIFDLNSHKLQPLATLRRLRAEPSLADVRAIGFVSHVQTELIRAARDAGTTEVLARSAFSKNIGDILRTA